MIHRILIHTPYQTAKKLNRSQSFILKRAQKILNRKNPWKILRGDTILNLEDLTKVSIELGMNLPLDSASVSIQSMKSLYYKNGSH